MDADAQMDMQEAGMAFLPRSVFGAMDLKPGQTVSIKIVDLDGEGEDGEVEVQVMGKTSHPEMEEREEESPMMAGVDELPESER